MNQTESSHPSDDSHPSTLVCPIYTAAQNHPHQIAVWTAERAFTYSELQNKVASRAAEMDELAGRRVALQSWNGMELIVTLFAAWRLKCFVLLLSPRVPSKERDAILVENGVYLIHNLTWLNLDGNSVGDEREGESASPVGNSRLISQHVHHGMGEVSAPLLYLNEPATGMLTSGSTGEPELVVHSVRNHVASAQSVQSLLSLTPSDSWLLSLPCFHVGGLAILWRCFLHGASIRMASGTFVDSDYSEGAPPTMWSVVPAQLYDIVQSGARAPDALRTVIVGGAPLSKALLRSAVSLGYPIRTSYGLTESSSMVCLSSIWKDVEEPVHAGRPLHGVTLTISTTGTALDGPEKDSASGVGAAMNGTVLDGKISIESDAVCLGHLKKGEFHPLFGPLFTQDRAEWTAQGQVRILGRADDVFISGGENISAQAIERVILALNDVIACTVVAAHHDRFGKRPVAFVQTLGGTVDENRIKEAIHGSLSSISMPDRILPMPLPEPGALKVTHEQLTQLARRQA